jgi:hypothetical protein
MTVFVSTLARVALAAVVCAAFSASAAADVLPVSVQIGGQIPPDGFARSIAGTAQADFGLNLDVGPKTLVPIRASFQLDDATSSNFNEFGVGVAARLTTPTYAGAGISLYSVNARYPPAAQPVGLDGASSPSEVSLNSTSVGENFFVGQRIVSLPGGVGLSVEAAYKNIPGFEGLNPSAVSLGLRLQL